MKRAALETAAALAATAWIPWAVDGWFVKNLVPLPSWPYGVSLAVFGFFLVKTLLMNLRPASGAAGGGGCAEAGTERAA